MAQNNKKSLKKTTYVQFQKLVDLMEENPQLATCTPSFVNSKATVEQTWDTIAESLNALGPPTRSGYEWKRVWQDQKFRLKKKLTDNSKCLQGREDVSLTELELQIDKICHLSSSTPEFQLSEPFTTDIADIKIEQSPPQTTKPIQETIAVRRPLYQQRKKKRIDSHTYKQKLLYQQMEIQNKTLNVMNKQLEASIRSTEVAKIQAEASKIQAEAAKEQVMALKEIANASHVMAQCLVDITKHLKGEDYYEKKLF